MGSALFFFADAAAAAATGHETDIISLIGRASPVAKAVLIILAAMVVLALALIVAKSVQLSRATDENRKFLNSFWNEKSVEAAYAKADQFAKSPISQVFKSGAREIKKISASQGKGNAWTVDAHGLENVGRALARSSGSEIASLEKYLNVLAVFSSAGPYIGLFGTVWGIMVAFQDIAAQGSATLATVAPGIAEALIATAFGLFVAIPAVIAYNMFAGRVKRQTTDMQGFSQDFLNIVQRGTNED